MYAFAHKKNILSKLEFIKPNLIKFRGIVDENGLKMWETIHSVTIEMWKCVSYFSSDVLYHLLLVALVVVVEHVVSAALVDHVHAVFGAGGTDYRGSESAS